jgi:hypothetical protein
LRRTVKPEDGIAAGKYEIDDEIDVDTVWYIAAKVLAPLVACSP